MLDCIDDKRGAILKAALDVFVAYGFRKTSMDDIARAAGMSRPALYQSFRNKEEIFRALADQLMREAIAKAEPALSGPGTFRERLFAAIDASILKMHRFVEETPHGAELVGINDEIADDIGEQWENALSEVIARGIASAERQGDISLDRFSADAGQVARIFVLGLEGLKQEVLRGRPIERHVRSLVDFTADALGSD